MERYDRRLAAVLVLDVAGYSRMMEIDGDGTHLRVRAVMDAIVQPAVDEAGGRVVKGTGDGALVEFRSVADAIRAACRIQRDNQEQEAARPAEQQVRLRIGINLGDVIAEPDDIYGDGVNVAARLEALAQPGEIVVSEAAMQAADRQGYRFFDLGAQRLKNIARPVRAYRLLPDNAPGQAPPTAGAPATLVPGFGDRPAIAVLPIRHLGMQQGHDHVADGLTEDIITALARWRSFPVIAGNSTFAYRGRDVDVRTVGMQLGVRYVVEGSLREDEGQSRLSIRLVDVQTTEALLAEQYDCDFDRLFAMQDELVRGIVGAIAPELLRHERDRVARAEPQSATAYELYQRGMWHHARGTGQDLTQARDCFAAALQVEPGYVHALCGMVFVHVHAANVGHASERHARYEEALRHARRAVQADPREPMARFVLGVTLENCGQADQAVVELREAVRLNPSYAAAHANLGFAYNYLGRPEEALPAVAQALRLSPHDPRRFVWMPAVPSAHYLARRYREALRGCQDALAARPDYPVPIRCLVATLGQLGRAAEAAVAIKRLRRLDGNLAGTEAYVRGVYVPGAADHVIEGLRRAGYD